MSPNNSGKKTMGICPANRGKKYAGSGASGLVNLFYTIQTAVGLAVCIKKAYLCPPIFKNYLLWSTILPT